jgi:hypothetical protein
MNTLLRCAIAAAIALPAAAMAGSTAQVTSDNNDGAGSLRAALASGATHIVINPSVDVITVTESLQYTGTEPLTLIGSGQTIDGAGMSNDLDPIFAVTQGADLTIKRLSFTGSGSYSRSDNLNNGVEVSGGKGIYLNVPDTRTGTVKVNLSGVSVFDTGNHGIHVSDCSLGDDCGGGGGGAGDGSPASIEVNLNDVLVDGVGFGKQDADGVRVDDRNDGNIVFNVVNSTFRNVGADGVELDEGNQGSVIINVVNTTFEGNGAYCVDGPFVAGDACDDEGDPDVDDGFDIDEAGPGDIRGKVVNTEVVNNFDEGLDFDEEDAGGYRLTLSNIYAENNEDEGVKISEENDGGIRVDLKVVTLLNNNGSKEDIEIEEADDGNVRASIISSTIDEVKVEEDGTGFGILKIRSSNIAEELDLDDVEVK